MNANVSKNSVSSPGIRAAQRAAFPAQPTTTTALPIYFRLPRAGERDALFGLSRSSWCLLVLPSKANDFRAPIGSVVQRQRGASRGVRLISCESAQDYFRQLEAEQADGTDAGEGGAN